MNRNKSKLLVLIAALISSTACQKNDIARANLPVTTSVETIASYPNGTFLENLDVGPKGELIFTSYLDRSIYRWVGQGAPTRFLQLDVHPVAVLSRDNDIVLTAHGKSFAEGAAFTQTNQFLVLDTEGKILRRTEAPQALFLNGMVELTPSTILAADSLAGVIWRFNPATGSLSKWLEDPLLATDPGQIGQRPGANGLKVRDEWLYISNSSRGAIYRVKLEVGQPKGGIEVVATLGPVDDFTFLEDGSIAATTHGDKLKHITPSRVITDIMSEGCGACTSVTTHGANAALIVLTTGGLLEGGKEPAKVLKVKLPAR